MLDISEACPFPLPHSLYSSYAPVDSFGTCLPGEQEQREIGQGFSITTTIIIILTMPRERIKDSPGCQFFRHWHLRAVLVPPVPRGGI